jgi:hypothetical protein
MSSLALPGDIGAREDDVDDRKDRVQGTRKAGRRY